MSKSLHIAMYPWFAMGHLTAFLHLANKLAQQGHRISFFLPPKSESKLTHFNLHPDLITFFPITFPHVEGLPLGAQLTSDVPLVQSSLLITALDRTRHELECKLGELKPSFVFFDYTQWMPELTNQLGIKSVHFCIINPATIAYLLVPSREQEKEKEKDPISQLQQQPLGFPSSSIKLKKHEAAFMHFVANLDFGNGTTFHERNMKSFTDCDVMAFKACQEIEGKFCDYIKSQFGKPVLLTGPVLPNQPSDLLKDRWVNWLGKFKKGSVIYVSFGSECILKHDQFQELVLGLESVGWPFLVALKPPEGFEKIEEALPKGFEDRVKERGVVYGGWMQQELLLKHPSIGCFVTHCGSGSISEALVSECQIVFLPNVGDQFINARLMGGDLEVGVEVEKRDEDGWYTKENVYKAVKLVMDEDSEVGREVRANHTKWREFLLSEGLEASYVKDLAKNLKSILG